MQEGDDALAPQWVIKPLKHSAFLASFYKDPKQFVGPHYAQSFINVVEIESEIQQAYKEITLPVNVTQPDFDSVCSNDHMN